MSKVFVYGSLKQGYGNNRLLCNSTFIGPDETADEAFDLRDWGAFPAVYKDEDGTSVIGELYEVNEGVMSSLDCLEGFPSFYNREIIALKSGEEAWMYYIDARRTDLGGNAYNSEPEGTRCPTGEWRPKDAHI